MGDFVKDFLSSYLLINAEYVSKKMLISSANVRILPGIGCSAFFICKQQKRHSFVGKLYRYSPSKTVKNIMQPLVLTGVLLFNFSVVPMSFNRASDVCDCI